MAFTTPKGRTNSSLSEINVTPMVDVMLVLLVIFMVTAPILQTGIDVQLPETRTVSATNPEQRVIISIGKDNDLFFGGEKLNFNRIGERLKQEVKGPKEPIYLRADMDVKYKTVAAVMDEIRRAGFTQILLVTRPLRIPERP